jgi:hypothetical protein
VLIAAVTAAVAAFLTGVAAHGFSNCRATVAGVVGLYVVGRGIAEF